MRWVYRYLPILFSLLMIMAFFVPKSDAQGPLPPKYSLVGDISLKYDRTWMSDGGDASDQFVHSYRLKLSSYISDPRLVQYDIFGSFFQEINNPADNRTTYSLGLNATFLNTQKINGIFRYFPKPISVRYSYQTDSDGNTFTNYGISMIYKSAEKVKLFYKGRLLYFVDERTGQNNSNNFSNANSNTNSNGNNNNNQSRIKGIPFPVFYLDYDVNTYKIDDRNVDTSHLNFRADVITPGYEYRFQFLRDTWDYDNLSDSSNRLSLDVNYHFFDKETKRRLEFFNRLEYYKQESAADATISFRNASIWSKPLGNNNFDSITVRGGLQFVKDAETSYGADISPVYTKRLTPRLTNTIGVAAGYQKTSTDNTHNESVFNSLYYDASRYLSLASSASLGLNQDGTAFGAGISAFTKTRIALAAGYDLAVIDTLDGRQTKHNFSMTAAGPLFNRLTFSTSAKYTIADIPELNNGFTSEDTMEVTGNLYYPFGKSTLTLEGRYLNVKRKGAILEQTKTTMLTATYYRILTRRTLFNLTTVWTKSNPGSTRYEVRPRLTVTYRQLYVNLEYNLIKETDPVERTTHKLLVNVTRSFGMKF